MIGSKVIKIAAAATFLTVAVVIGIIATVLLLNDKNNYDTCQKKVPSYLKLSEKDNKLNIEWEGGSCFEMYSLMIYIDNVLMEIRSVYNDSSYLSNNLMPCTTATVVLTVDNVEEDAIEAMFIPVIGSVSNLEVSAYLEGAFVIWSNVNLLRCKFEIQVNEEPVELLDVGKITYEINHDLVEACVEHMVKVTPIGPGVKGVPTSANFEIGPIVNDFKISKSDSDLTYLKAVWTSNHQKCTYNVYYNSEIVCPVICADTSCICDDIQLEEEHKPCHSYLFDLKAKNSENNNWDVTNYSYDSLSTGTIQNFNVVYEEFKTIAKWDDLSPSCQYKIVVGSDPMNVDRSQCRDQSCQQEISTDSLDLCITTEITLIATNVKDAEVARKMSEYEPTPDIEEVHLETDTTISATWMSLGATCSYNVKFDEMIKSDIKETIVDIDNIFGVSTTYCVDQKVFVSVTTTSDNTGNWADSSTIKALKNNFEAIQEDMSPILLPDTSHIRINWNLVEVFSKCEDVYYMVSCSLDEGEQTNPERIYTTAYVASKCTLDAKTRTFQIYIQPVQENKFGEDITGSTMKCDFDVDFSTGGVDRTSCDYLHI